MSLTTKTPDHVVPAYNLPRGRAVEAAQKIAEAEAPHAAQAAQAPEGRVVVHRVFALSVGTLQALDQNQKPQIAGSEARG
jgi:hypothetical protein